MKTLFILFIVIICISCSDNNTKQEDSVLADVSIYLKNSSGVDVLGSDKYPTSSIYAQYLINGKIVQNVSNAVISDYPNNVHIIKEGNLHYATIFLNTSLTDEYPITYIHWNSTDVDTIKAQYKRNIGIDGNNVLLEKAWLFENNAWKELSLQRIAERSSEGITGGIIIVK